jgi:DNA-binding transcriptional LysR family regulator
VPTVPVSPFKVFRDIAQTSSISRAAELNGLSQSAASQFLRHLEEQLQVDLLDRTTRPLRLTSAGRLYYDACRDIVRRHEEVESEIDSLKVQLVGSVRVASIYSIGLYEMARMKEQFEKAHPQADVHLEYMRPDKVVRAVLDDQADLGLISYPSPFRNIKAIPWKVETMVLVCHPSHPLAKKKSISPEDLADQDFVSFDPDLSIRKAMERFFRDHGIHRNVVLEFDNIQMIKEAVSIGSGISILPEPTVRQEAAEGRLIALPIESDGFVRPISILHRRGKAFSPAVDEFLKFLQEQSKSKRYPSG